MLRYSSQALWARRKFFAPYNDINIIVEDTSKENFYTNLFTRLLQGELRIGKVIGVGGKSQVLERCYSQERTQQPEFFLVDGDFDEILRRPYPDQINFYRLSKYDIESFLIDETAICLIAEEQAPAIAVETHRDSLRINDWLSNVITSSIRLAAAAALWQELGIRVNQISQGIQRHSQNAAITPEAEKIAEYINDRKTQQSAVKPIQFDVLLNRMVKRMGASEDEWLRWISGKHILIPLMVRLMNRHTGSQLNQDSLCFRLALHCDLSELQELRSRILSIA